MRGYLHDLVWDGLIGGVGDAKRDGLSLVLVRFRMCVVSPRSLVMHMGCLEFPKAVMWMETVWMREVEFVLFVKVLACHIVFSSRLRVYKFI